MFSFSYHRGVNYKHINKKVFGVYYVLITNTFNKRMLTLVWYNNI